MVSSIYLAGSAIDLEDTISPEDYLAKLNDNDTYGCKNSIRINPDVIVLGDSHAYAGLDFNLLADAFGTQKIAACTLGSMFVESVLFALKHYESLGELPKTVIYATSTRGFLEAHNKKEMVFSHKSQITSINTGDLLFSVQNLFAYLFRRESDAFEDMRARLKRHTPLVEALDEKNIAAVLDQSATRAKHMSSWLHRIEGAVFKPEAEKWIQEICELVERNGIELFIVAVPESPWLEKQYPAWQVEKYHSLLNRFSPYAADVLIYSTSDTGLGNRHFINRSLKDGYDYAKWSDPEYTFSEDLNADHLGIAGAMKFTKIAARDMLKARRSAPASD